MTTWRMIGIKHERLNGLKLLTRLENRRTPGNTLDTILNRAGVPELTDEELEQKLAELEEERRRTNLKALEASIK